MTYQFPEAPQHGALTEVLKDIFFVSGGVKLPGPLPMSFSRNMTVIREGQDLTVVNSMRLSAEGMRQLDQLGLVKHVIRLAGFHGMDDPFYKDRYGAKVWAVQGQPYVKGFDALKSPQDTYFKADVEMDASTQLPVANAKIYHFKTTQLGEALLHLGVHGGVLVSGDCLQNWSKADEFFSLPAKIMMNLMGFIKPYNIGPGWLKLAKPSNKEVGGILDLEFNHVLPVHGSPVLGNAKDCYRPRLQKFI